MHSFKLLEDKLNTIESFLNFHPLGSLQKSVREIEVVHNFHAIHSPKSGRLIEGFIWAPNTDDIQYEINLEREGVPTIEIIMGSEDRAADIEKVKSEIPSLFETAKIRKASFGKKGGGGKGKKGYYLEVGVAKEKALLNFENALLNGIGTSEFVQFCTQRNFKMTYFKGSEANN